MAVIKRILVVDDNRDVADTLGVLLTQIGYEVRIVYDGPSALNVANEFEPDIMLLDVVMRGMDGLEVAKTIRQKNWGRPIIIAVTGRGQPQDHKLTNDSGFDFHLVKPVEIDTLGSVHN